MAVTLSDLTTAFYDILRESGASSAYPQNFAELLLNAAQQDICSGRVINPITRDEARKWDLYFLNTEAYFSNTKWTYTTADLTIWATTIYADTTSYPSTWNLFIGGNIVTYTGTTATSFTWCSNVLFARPSGTNISFAFTLPTDFSTIINVTYNNKFKLPAKKYDDIFEDLNQYKWSNYQRNNIPSMYTSPYRVRPFYTIKDAAYLLIYQLNDVWYPIQMRYEKLAPTMTSSVWPIIDNDTYAKMCIPPLAVWNMLYNRWEEGRAAQVLQYAIANIRQMYSYYNDTVYESQNGVQYKIWKNRINI